MGRILFILFSASSIAFLLLTWLVWAGQTQGFDQGLMIAVEFIRNPTLTWLMAFISSFGDGFFAAIVFFAFALALLLRGYRRQALFSFLIWIGPILSWAIKNLVGRERPEGFLTEKYSLPPDFSFPSGHVVFYTVFFGLIAFYALTLPRFTSFGRKIWSGFSILLISTVGISRVYLGVHWPSDALGGYLLGFAVLTALIFAYFRFSYNK